MAEEQIIQHLINVHTRRVQEIVPNTKSAKDLGANECRRSWADKLLKNHPKDWRLSEEVFKPTKESIPTEVIDPSKLNKKDLVEYALSLGVSLPEKITKKSILDILSSGEEE